MEKIVILAECKKNDWTFKEWKKNNLEAYIIFSPVSKIFRAIRRLWMTIGLPRFDIWYSKEWFNKVKCADIVIIHSIATLFSTLPLYINKINPKAKVIVWYWNSVQNSLKPWNIKGSCEKWSFDPKDCTEYDLKYNHQYYFKSLILPQNNHLEYDVYFCGLDANRGEMLMNIYNKLKNLGLNNFFQIVNSQYKGIPKNLKSQYRPYHDLIDNVSRSRCLLEVVKSGQSGATIRLMEALFNNKKIITTNKTVKEEPFYDSHNIFIIGERPDSELYDFVKSDYVNPGHKFIEEYDVKQWLSNFTK